MKLENFNKLEITDEQFDLLCINNFGTDIWVSDCTEQWVSMHDGILILHLTEEIFNEDDKEWRTMPTKYFILTPKI
jgi:hypothetical protein